MEDRGWGDRESPAAVCGQRGCSHREQGGRMVRVTVGTPDTEGPLRLSKKTRAVDSIERILYSLAFL